LIKSVKLHLQYQLNQHKTLHQSVTILAHTVIGGMIGRLATQDSLLAPGVGWQPLL